MPKIRDKIASRAKTKKVYNPRRREQQKNLARTRRVLQK